MKRILFLIACHLYSVFLIAQKPSLDITTPDSWPIITSYTLSDDGKFTAYHIGSEKAGYSLVVRSNENEWKKEFASASDPLFTQDNRRLLYNLPGDSLGMFNLETKEGHYLTGVKSFKTPGSGDGQWLAYQSSGSEKRLTLINFSKKTETNYSDVDNYTFNGAGDAIIFQTEDSGKNNKIVWIDLKNMSLKVISQGFKAENIIFDKNGDQLAFISKSLQEGKDLVKLHYFKYGMDSAVLECKDSLSAKTGMSICYGKDAFFSQDGSEIFFFIEKKSNINEGKLPQSGAHVEVLHYRQDELKFIRGSGPFLAVIHLDSDNKLVRLQQDSDHFIGPRNSNRYQHNRFVLFESNNFGQYAEYKWRKSATPDLFLVNTADGSRTLIKKHLNGGVLSCQGFSPTGKYVCWFDGADRQWYSYDIAHKSINEISAGIHVPLFYNIGFPDFPWPEGIVGWLKNDSALLIYDRRDIWQVDPRGIKIPVNLTREYGIRNNVRLRYINFNNPNTDSGVLPDTLILSAVNLSNKWNGFFALTIGKYSQFRQLAMQPRLYYFPPTYSEWNGLRFRSSDYYPLKAKNTNIFLFRPSTAKDYPNLEITTDFIHFKPITDLAPQKEFNWYADELMRWKMPDGTLNEGILYKPENFDPLKKYPLIFLYYERHSDALNAFCQPELSNADINIPYYVSNGYLVFVPDIHYKTGYPGKSAYDAVVSAAKYLSGLPWVDSKKMGLKGHSFGGFETNYIVAHTSLFAAAAPGAGLSNMTEAYNNLGGIQKFQWYFEVAQYRMGASLWQRPDLYIQNSPIFRADKVTTPILILANRGDGIVTFDQGGQWFSALSRLGKKVWLLSYEGEGHTLDVENNKLDYSIRLKQFFDHYLKDLPAPKWMTEGTKSLEMDINSKDF